MRGIAFFWEGFQVTALCSFGSDILRIVIPGLEREYPELLQDNAPSKSSWGWNEWKTVVSIPKTIYPKEHECRPSVRVFLLSNSPKEMSTKLCQCCVYSVTIGVRAL